MRKCCHVAMEILTPAPHIPSNSGHPSTERTREGVGYWRRHERQ